MITWINRYPVFARAALWAPIAACVFLASAAGLFSQAAPAPPPPQTSFKFDFGPGQAPEGYTRFRRTVSIRTKPAMDSTSAQSRRASSGAAAIRCEMVL